MLENNVIMLVVGLIQNNLPAIQKMLKPSPLEKYKKQLEIAIANEDFDTIQKLALARKEAEEYDYLDIRVYADGGVEHSLIKKPTKVKRVQTGKVLIDGKTYESFKEAYSKLAKTEVLPDGARNYDFRYDSKIRNWYKANGYKKFEVLDTKGNKIF